MIMQLIIVTYRGRTPPSTSTKQPLEAHLEFVEILHIIMHALNLVSMIYRKRIVLGTSDAFNYHRRRQRHQGQVPQLGTVRLVFTFEELVEVLPRFFFLFDVYKVSMTLVKVG